MRFIVPGQIMAPCLAAWGRIVPPHLRSASSATPYAMIRRSRVHQGCEVIGVGIHFVAVPGVAGPAVAATVMGNTAITLGRQEEHLRPPTVRTQRPPVTENDGLTRAPVLVADLCAVFGGDR